MHPILEAASKRLDIDLPALTRAASFSKREVQDARLFFRDNLGRGHGLDIVVCGSMARMEMSSASDFDYLIVAHGLVEDASRLRTFRKACDEWCKQRAIDPPGKTGVFGRIVSGAELVDQIGLEFDTNASLTRRVLVLEESVSLLEPELHRKLVEVIIGRYLYDEHGEANGPPRFLLNDVVRYWRTIAVDYEAKVWRDLTVDGWGVRYLKLRISRKLTFASALVSLFLVELTKPSDLAAFLRGQFVDVPALARLAQLVDVLDDDESALQDLRRVLELADAFCAFLDDPARRDAANEVCPPASEAGESSFVAMRAASIELQDCLERLFFDATELRGLGRKYLAF